MPGRVHLHRHRVTGASYPTGRCPLCSRTVEVETARVTRAASSLRRPWASLLRHSGHTSGPTSSWTCTSAAPSAAGGYHVRSLGNEREGQAVVASLRRYIREGSLFRENAATRLACRGARWRVGTRRLGVRSRTSSYRRR